MSVGKGSIKRAAQAKEAVKEGKKETVAEQVAPVKKAAPAKKPAAKPAAKAPAKKAPAKSPARKDTVVAASVISSDDIHEKKFETVSRIYCELPTYLL